MLGRGIERRIRMKTRAIRPITVATIAMVVLMAISAAMASAESGWTIRVDLAFVDPAGDEGVVVVEAGSVEVGLDAGAGAGVRGEYRFSPRLGLEVGMLGTASVDISTFAGGGGTGAAVGFDTFAPVTTGLNVHLTPQARLDLYAGPLLAYASYSDVEVRAAIGDSAIDIAVDRDLGVGAIIGLDVPIGKRGWLFGTSLRFIKTSMQGSNGDALVDVDYDPAIVSFGFGYSF
jgi:outer membrane protein W